MPMSEDKRESRVDTLGKLIVAADAFAAAEDFFYDTRTELILTDVNGAVVAATAKKLSRLIGEDAPVFCDGAKSTAANIVPCAELKVPSLGFVDKRRHDFADLVRIMRRLCADDGCEWDKAQTHESIRANVIEEAYELVEAIDNKDVPNMREECGDVMLQSVFHCEIAEKGGEFDLGDVLSELCEKLITRHPHVFGDVVATNADESLASWEAAKAKEKGAYKASDKMKRTAAALPAVERALKVQKAAAKAKFDFADARAAAVKMFEELDECLNADGAEEREKECGDLLFAAVNVVRLLKCDPEVALSRAVRKFVDRFSKLESLADRPVSELTPEQADALWEEVKKSESR